MRSGDPTEGVGASRRAAPSPVPSASPASDADRLAPFRFGPGYSPWKDPTVLTLLAISLIAAVLFVGGATFGPALAGDDDGDGVFPIVDILTGDDGGDDAALSLATNRTEVSIGERVAFTVTTGNDTSASNATVSVGGADHPVDESGRVVVRVGQAGEVTASASAPGTDDATLESNEVALSVAPVAVQLRVQHNRSVATAGEPTALTLVRTDTGAALRGSLATTLVPGGELLPADEARRVNGSRLVIVPERAGTLHVVGAREDDSEETFHGYAGTVAVERSEVALDLDVEPTATTDGGRIDVAVTRVDAGDPIEGTVAVAGRSIATDANGTASLRVDAVGEQPIVATAPNTSAVTFTPATATVSVANATVDLSIVDGPGSVAPGESFSVTVRATNRGPEPGTDALRFHVDGERADRGSVTLDSGDGTEITFVGTAPDAPGDVVVTVAGSDARASRTIAVET